MLNRDNDHWWYPVDHFGYYYPAFLHQDAAPDSMKSEAYVSRVICQLACDELNYKREQLELGKVKARQALGDLGWS